jgi:hypothetical protein
MTPTEPGPLNVPTEPGALHVPTGLAEHLRGASRTFVQSLLSVLGKAGDSDERKLEAVRAEVLRLLEGCGPASASLHMRVRHCTDLEEMWYLRPQLNGVFLAGLGDELAESAMQRITALFVGAGLPVAAASKPRRR